MSRVEQRYTPPLTVRGRAFWVGFPALVLAFAVAQMLAQIDLAMLAHQAPGMPAAYVMLARLALLDLLASMALGSVVSVRVARALREGQPGPVMRGALTLAAILGLLLSAVALLAYPPLAAGLSADDAALRALLLSAIPWFAATAPLRLLNGCAAFILHASQQGPLVVRWKLWELLAKVGLNLLFIECLGFGFVGCFMASLLMHLGSCAWVLRRLQPQMGRGRWLPAVDWARAVLRQSAWEGLRLLSLQLLGLMTLVLFAAPQIAPVDTQRLDAFAAASLLALLVFAPLVALIRFLAMRFAGLAPHEVLRLLKQLLRLGVAGTALLGGLLIVLGPWLGQWVYAQQGRWWSSFVLMLGVSLPLRLAGNAMRAALQSLGEFVAIAKVDALLGWAVGLPLLVLGLRLDLPLVAYGYVLLPEAAAVLWLARRIQRIRATNPQPGGLCGAMGDDNAQLPTVKP
ncbi:multi antimicrobial extrusion protein MatE [Pseudomonas sp. LD120]|uniref:multi antimicrobial extrusion protein MatE n=1 Tax=Pseudomonas sp. LD120 TaxID=485751 RepID=UPI00135B4DF7|nr:multi antimicrobial extrusion protein MatE [Pseudomonas sp. LD120]KAF0866582.1 multi antimicrobial extrusion protein MatE [Pseudomonas sp. LD120]